MPRRDPEKSREYGRRHYAKYREYYLERNKRLRAERKKWLGETKASLRCVRCGENHPACLQFHHLDPSEKERNIAAIYWHWSIERIKKEMAKCEVLCANCHFKLHWEEKTEE